jgi:PAS domain-containing protein
MRHKEVRLMNSGSDRAGGVNEAVGDVMFYRLLIDSLPKAVLTVKADFKITGFNPGAEKVTGYTEAEVMGRSCGDILQCGMCHIRVASKPGKSSTCTVMLSKASKSEDGP